MGLYATYLLNITLPKVLPVPVEDKLEKLINLRPRAEDRVWQLLEGRTCRTLMITEEVKSTDIEGEFRTNLEWLVKIADYGIGGTPILGIMYDERDSATYHVCAKMNSETHSLEGIRYKKLIEED